MNKFGMVLGVAAVATLAGCKDPDYNRGSALGTTGDVKNADTTSVAVTDDVKTPAKKHCTCAPGTKHAEPCACGADDCKCVVEPKTVVTTDLSKKPDEKKPDAPKAAAEEYTIYVVQSGDYLAKISKKFNVTIASIKRLNPSIKKDVVWVGQKLKLPGKIDVPAAPAVTATAPKAAAKGAFKAYTGATKEYIVKNGDTLGAIAYGNGINIRQLKEMNGLASDSLKVGQKLKVPAEKVAKAATAAAPAVAAKPSDPKTDAAKVAETTAPKAAASVTAEKTEEKVEEAALAAEAVATAETAEKTEEKPAAETKTYAVQEGDDVTGVAIRWGVSSAQIRELNNLSENDKLVPGQVIKLPAEAVQQ